MRYNQMTSKERAQERDFLLDQQDYRCKICQLHIEEGKEKLDHDHLTGFIRGVLCGRCNIGLGVFLDNPAIMVEAIQYLIRHWHGDEKVVRCDWTDIKAVGDPYAWIDVR